MSSEQVDIDHLKIPKINDIDIIPDIEITPRVDINLLLSRVRAEKRKENKLNYVYFAMASAVILIMGIIILL